ncbi:MerR family transcriptional regulator [Acrocarpospora pleiomorpha]|uniref:MerR family transcriptional regulator n=1 Tax=Acrocarpospora pleiomorpha TaxID=90975 RepID=A0A5M3XK26_9ACTN|nr:MerR family transcriptional regulator [Acrocarpospora pleiomorpha]GES21202.1 MerR family transcriptional regulator [Acrocarpospora pleiomorpha]
MAVFTPGQVSEETGFSLDTLRYYERIGLLGNVGRNAAGQRRFTDGDVGWLNMLRCLRDTGMPIAEMLRFAELVRQGDHTVRERIELLEAHDEGVERQIATLRRRQGHIHYKIQYYKDVMAIPQGV